uniref:low-density lipoprotein receptor-related protein 1B-like n=1 Tax=Styela clava TaxID=7725 RepID=UPI0019394FEE|nr:low-density lipoprotein receptor-related protein 1B-like [Styela clava]
MFSLTKFYVLAIVMTYLQCDFSAAEVRWCINGTYSDVNDYNTYENATQYNDELNVCMECSNEAKVLLIDERWSHECCNGKVKPVGHCKPADLKHLCNNITRCDGIKQCYDSWDEKGCYGCKDDTFSCNDQTDGKQCLPMSKVCDGVKNCRGGKDETLCPYYGGWCDGFLCGGKHPKCLNYTQICDGTKDCVDGSDENNCQYCLNQFRCRVYVKEDIVATSAECIGKFRVCDGITDCQNGLDESYCNRWQEWSTWSECGTITESCTRIRRRSCVNKDKVVVSSSLCYDGDDIIDTENHIDICPECLDDVTTPFMTGTRKPTTTPTISNNTTTISLKQGSGWGLPFGLGAQIGIAVAGCLLLVALIIALIFCIFKLKWHRGFWRPPSKLPRPSRSNLPGPGTTIPRVRKVKIKPGKIPHPYPIKDPKVITPPIIPPPLPKTKALSIRSISGNGLDSGIEDSVDSMHITRRMAV